MYNTLTRVEADITSSLGMKTTTELCRQKCRRICRQVQVVTISGGNALHILFNIIRIYLYYITHQEIWGGASTVYEMV